MVEIAYVTLSELFVFCFMRYRKRKNPEESDTHVAVVKTGVVKCSFPGKLKEIQIRKDIETWVEHVSKIANRGSLVLNRLLIYCLENNVQDRTFPDLLSTTTFRHCFLVGTKSVGITTPYVQTVWNRAFRGFPVAKRIIGDTAAINAAVVQYMTATKKHFKENLQRKLNAWVRHWMEQNEINDDHFDAIRYAINGWKCDTVIPEKARDFVTYQRNLLQPPANGVNNKWLFKNLKVVVKYFWRAAKYMEQFEGTRRYNIAPIARIGSRYLNIDTETLYFLLKNAGLVTGSYATFKDIRDEHFNSVFNFKGLSSKKFGNLVQTDGVGMSVHFQKTIWIEKKKTELENEEEEEGQEEEREEEEGEERTVDHMEVNVNRKRAIGADPGRVNLLQTVVDEADGTRRFFKLKRKAYYRWSGMLQHHLVTEQLRSQSLEIETAEAIYGKVSTKTTDSASWDEALKTYISVYDQLWNVRMDKKWLQSKFRVYCLKRKTLDRFFSQMALPGSDTIVAYGAAHFSSTARGERSAPTTAMKQACRRHFKTVEVDEHYTSQVCPYCEKLLGEVIEVKEDGRDIPLRGLRRCWSTVCSQHFLLGRDKIAALNIKRCYEAGDFKNRPKSLQPREWLGVKRPPVTRIQFTNTEARVPLLRRVSVVQA